MEYGQLRHEPVLAEEILEKLEVRGDGVYCDATLGGGGFSLQLKNRLTTGMLICLDRDPEAVENARALFAGDERVRVVHANFARIAEIWDWPRPQGVVYDLGLSSIQLADPERGLSFQSDAPLDMRLDLAEPAPTAADIVNTYSQAELEKLFREYGEIAASRIARRIVEERRGEPIVATERLARIVCSAAKKKA